MRLTRWTVLAAMTASIMLVAACGTLPTPTPSPTGPPPVESAGPPLAGQTDTEWGRIWDTLPSDFPVYPGATPADDAAQGPASATLVVEGVDPSAVATWTDSALSSAGFTITGGRESLEDGSIALDAVRGTDCRVLVSIAPLGSVTSIAILYGAACPSP